jgi:hypothetical protein
MENTESGGAGNTPPKQYPMIDSLCLELKQLLRSLEPSPQVTEHFRNARIEVLKGVRQVIDNRIQHLSRSPQPGRKIVVE